MDLAVAAVVALSGGLLVLGLVGPAIAQRRLRRTRRPTDTDREHLDGLLPAGVEVPARVLVIETVGEASTEVAIRGPPGARILFVTDHVLTSLEAPIARALLTAEACRCALWYREYQVVAAAVAVALGSAGMLLVVPFAVGFGGMVVAAPILFAIGRQVQYRADARAAAVVGASPLAAAFETVATRHGGDLSSGGWRTLVSVQPTIGDRIHRLRARD